MNKLVNKGYILEEVLRSYFLRSGFFVVRGVPYNIDNEDHTDIDLWLYERPTGTSRRIMMVDIKGKKSPHAVERIAWTKGMTEILSLDGGYVATTDSRSVLKKIAKSVSVRLLDGNDVKRIQDSGKVIHTERYSDEELQKEIKDVDKARKDKDFLNYYKTLKGSVLNSFGPSTSVRALDIFSYFANKAIEAHPNSKTSIIAGRLSYLAASIIAIALDFVDSESPFCTKEERYNRFVNSIRYGVSEKLDGLEKIRLSKGLVREYLENGDVLSSQLEKNILNQYEKIPAEIIAEQATKYKRLEGLFEVAKNLEHMAYSNNLLSFDLLQINDRSFVGSLLDFCEIERSIFASAWECNKKLQTTQDDEPQSLDVEINTQNTLFTESDN